MVLESMYTENISSSDSGSGFDYALDFLEGYGLGLYYLYSSFGELVLEVVLLSLLLSMRRLLVFRLVLKWLLVSGCRHTWIWIVRWMNHGILVSWNTGCYCVCLSLFFLGISARRSSSRRWLTTTTDNFSYF